MTREQGTLADAQNHYHATYCNLRDTIQFTAMMSTLSIGSYAISTFADEKEQPFIKGGLIAVAFVCGGLTLANVRCIYRTLREHYQSWNHIRETQRDISILERQLQESDKTPSREL